MVLAYALGTLAWLPAIFEKNELAVTGTIWLLLSLAATVCIGLFVFHEQLTPLQWCGLGLAFMSIALLNL